MGGKGVGGSGHAWAPFNYSLNTTKGSRNAGSGVGGGGGGGGVGGDTDVGDGFLPEQPASASSVTAKN